MRNIVAWEGSHRQERHMVKTKSLNNEVGKPLEKISANLREEGR